MRNILLICLVASSYLSYANDATKITFDDLQKVYSKTNDTTYVINFWATWCKPCIEELPEFQKALQNHSPHKVKFIFVSLDFPDAIDRVNMFIDKKEYDGTFYLLTDTDANSWIPKIDTEWDGNIPVTLIVNNENSFTYFQNGKMTFEELNNQINKSNKQ